MQQWEKAKWHSLPWSHKKYKREAYMMLLPHLFIVCMLFSVFVVSAELGMAFSGFLGFAAALFYSLFWVKPMKKSMDNLFLKYFKVK